VAHARGLVDRQRAQAAAIEREKRSLGTWAPWLGVLLLAGLGLVLVPKAKLLRTVHRIDELLTDGLPFQDYRSLIGLLEHLRCVYAAAASIMYSRRTSAACNKVSMTPCVYGSPCSSAKQYRPWQNPPMPGGSLSVAASAETTYLTARCSGATHADEITAPRSAGERLFFVSERRLGFGARPSSNIAQRFSEAGLRKRLHSCERTVLAGRRVCPRIGQTRHHEELRLPKGGVRRSGSPIEVHGGPQDELQSQGRGSHIPRESSRDVDPPQVGESPKNGACIRDAKVVHLWLCPRRGASGENVGHRWWSERGNRKGRRRRPSPQHRCRRKTHCSHHSRRGGCLC
jgi:hypothetical protein